MTQDYTMSVTIPVGTFSALGGYTLDTDTAGLSELITTEFMLLHLQLDLAAPQEDGVEDLTSALVVELTLLDDSGEVSAGP